MHGDEGLGYLDKSGIAELTFKGRHKTGRESRLANRLPPRLTPYNLAGRRLKLGLILLQLLQ